jgi:uncharacterized protein (UPF0248 family)
MAINKKGGFIGNIFGLVIILIILGFMFIPDTTLTYLKKSGEWLIEKGGPVVDKLMIRDKPSPQDWIAEDQIKVYKDRVELNIQNVRWSKFTDTKSMDPVLDQGANGLEIVPESEDDIKVGDIISYKQDEDTIIIHRVVEINEDEKGWYAVAKGDNNKARDPYKIRFNNIEGVLIGVIY